MKASEIRVNNWLIDPREFGEIAKKYQLRQDNYFKATARDIQYADEFAPIPLTEEIILKCGFENDTVVLYIGNFMLLQGEDDYTVAINSISNQICDIKYLHQLQNIYFAYKGQELEINL